MLFGDVAVVQASAMDGLSFDPFSFQKDGLAAPEVDVGRCQVGDALVVSSGRTSQRARAVRFAIPSPKSHKPFSV
jgi:hypothetical protein